MLRKWQSHCVDAVIRKYSQDQPHFLCQATPGAGKTVMAAEVAKRLFDEGKIDLVVCFSPSLAVAEGMKNTFSWKLKCSFNGGLGSLGASYTYQTIRFLDDTFWNTIKKYRVLAVFDEIHHCSSDCHGQANVWGEQVLTKIQGMAKFTLALSGTPWRSDSVPIAMAEYTDPEGQLICDYQYSLKQAIEDGVCRAPQIALIDNEHLTIVEGRETKSFSSILELLKQSDASYQSVIHNEAAMNYVLECGCRKLNQIRLESPRAGGLIVAASIKHAKQILAKLVDKFQQSACIVTYHHDEPLKEIEAFRHSDTQWIVSVGMISEGTDIPRLQVCCHMSSIKTELYFRQVLGRILRINDSPNQEAWLYTFAEESLIGFAERIEQDIPDSCMYIKQESNVPSTIDEKRLPSSTVVESVQSNHSQPSLLSWGETSDVINSHNAGLALAWDELRLGQFKERVIAAFI
ncbi:diguanylate cyclase [Vibrio sp. 03-59-1]|uniref:DEAD/DEAH box helicase n=1 Tax=Vibrio sp. 03-59-1 TaxID=2607607 RepID=UPI001493D616|nr:DEAD/DEAH box helicase family protein [Vibrio sp. 03-59-1]NOH84245.1 diguanylate cyclase [Vibrio sp. 03-59-1]